MEFLCAADGWELGIVWLTEDRCDGTFVSVSRGVVDVTDFGLRKHVLVKAGQSYLARKRP